MYVHSSIKYGVHRLDLTFVSNLYAGGKLESQGKVKISVCQCRKLLD